MTVLTIHDILQLLPHRYPFLLVDRVVAIEPGVSLVAKKNVTMNEPFFVGHFPQQPVMPGVLIIEAMAQASAILAYHSTQSSPKDYLFFLASIEGVKFKLPVEPGDTLMIHTRIERVRNDFYRVACEAFVEDKLVCQATILSVRRKVGA